MLVSKHWIEEYVDLPDKTHEEIGDDLTLKVVEVEDVIDQAESFDHIVVGKILEVTEHPNADTLYLCTVDTGDETLPVVCGGSNLSQGMLIAMGKVGAKVRWHGQGDLVELKKTKIRGEVSMGMICAAEEIGLGDMFQKEDEKEILDVSHLDVPLGTRLDKALGLDDVVYDIDNKSMTHRPDLWGHYGMAREFAAIYEQELKELNPPDIQEGTEKKIEVHIQEPDVCARYMGVILDGVTIGPSPEWMQKRLVAVGVNPINNIVDITNYVMLELGQPMHAFDFQTLAKEKEQTTIFVRHAKKHETMVLLGGDEVELSEEMLVIADAKNPIAVAGVKGGEESGVTEKTSCIIFESANFHSLSVRRTSSTLHIRTDASSRFEKGLDPNLPELALRRAVELTRQLCPEANVVSNIADEKNFSLDQGPIRLSADFIRSRVGASIATADIVSMLERLGFEIAQDGEDLSVTIPTWRATGDIGIKEDIVEEIARMYGYEHIPTTFPKFPIMPPPEDPMHNAINTIKMLLAYDAGYTESFSYSFVSPKWLEKIGEDPSKHLELKNPIAKDRPLIRRNLIPNILEQVEANLHTCEMIQMFEVGRVFDAEQPGSPEKFGDDGKFLPKQDTQLALVYAAKGDDTPFFALSGVLQQLLDRLGMTDVQLKKSDVDHPLIHGGRYAEIFVKDMMIGHIGEIHPVMQQTIGLPYRTAMVQVTIDACLPYITERITYSPLPKYPGVERDMAFVVDRSVQHQDVVETMQSVDPLIHSVELFDVYQGEHVPAGKKSMAYHIEYRSDERTLTAEEVEKVHKKLKDQLVNKFHIELREG